jgi:hypothetical protein
LALEYGLGIGPSRPGWYQRTAGHERAGRSVAPPPGVSLGRGARLRRMMGKVDSSLFT